MAEQTRGNETDPAGPVAFVPGDIQPGLKALARATGDEKIDTVPLEEVKPLTGSHRGGVTALACKKPCSVYVD